MNPVFLLTCLKDKVYSQLHRIKHRSVSPRVWARARSCFYSDSCQFLSLCTKLSEQRCTQKFKLNGSQSWEDTVNTISPNREQIFMSTQAASEKASLGRAGSDAIGALGPDRPHLMLEEFRFEQCAPPPPIEIFIDLYKNTTFNLKSPLASLYKH